MLELSWEEKSTKELADERRKHADIARQMSMFDVPTDPLDPCPLKFFASWSDGDAKMRRHECDDWETSTAFLRFERDYSRERAIEILREKYEGEYFQAGLALAFSTHSRRNITTGAQNQWLLVGLIRLDADDQTDLFLT